MSAGVAHLAGYPHSAHHDLSAGGKAPPLLWIAAGVSSPDWLRRMPEKRRLRFDRSESKESVDLGSVGMFVVRRRDRVAPHQHPRRGVETNRVASQLRDEQRHPSPVRGRSTLMRRAIRENHVTLPATRLVVRLLATRPYQGLGVGSGEPRS
jgi:hypothetical protein